MKLKKLYSDHIVPTKRSDSVEIHTTQAAFLTYKVRRVVQAETNSVRISSVALKHIHDKRPDFCDLFVDHVDEFIRYPDAIHKNLETKKGHFCFIKNWEDKKYMCSLERVESGGLYVVTFFPTNDSYIKKHPYVWSWRDGSLSS